MNMRAGSVATIVLVCLSSAISSRGAAQNDKLQIHQVSDAYVLSVPVSQLVMTIPRNGLSLAKYDKGGATNNPRYFYLRNEAQNLIVSGWFEPANSFSSTKKIWEESKTAWKKQGLSDPQNVVFKKIGDWDAIIYDLAVPKGTDSHIQAHLVQAGTWIEIHISIASTRSSAECRVQLLTLLKKIGIEVRKD